MAMYKQFFGYGPLALAAGQPSTMEKRWDTVEVVVFDVDEGGFVVDQNRAGISLLLAV